MSTSRASHRHQLPCNYTTWTQGLSSGTVIIAVNSTFIPEAVPSSFAPAICKDGLWGVYEWTRHPQLYREDAPYLGFIKLPINGDEKYILLQSLDKTAWRPMPGKNGFHTYAEEWERQLRERYSWASKFCKDVFPKVQRMVP
jgi:hypothetical protein